MSGYYAGIPLYDFPATECSLCGDATGFALCAACKKRINAEMIPVVCLGCRQQHCQSANALSWSDKNDPKLREVGATLDAFGANCGFLVFVTAHCDHCNKEIQND